MHRSSGSKRCLIKIRTFKINGKQIAHTTDFFGVINDRHVATDLNNYGLCKQSAHQK